MKPELKYDPRTKQNIKDTLHSYLYEPVIRKFRERLAAIITANSNALGSSHGSFIYRNEVYQLNEQEKLPRKMNRLIPQLHDQMDTYLREVNELNMHEIPYVMGFINQVLNSSDDLNDYLRVLPETMHRPLKELMDSCPCRTTKLSPETVEEMRTRNNHSIELMKRRLVTNLLLN